MKPIKIGKLKIQVSDENINEIAMILVLCLMIAAFSIASPDFFSQRNLINILRQVTMIGITSFGLTFMLIAGGVDLSTGQIVALSGVTVTLLMVKFSISPWLAVIITLVIASIMGYFNGGVAIWLRIPSLVSTLAMMQVYSGIAFILTKGQTIYGFPDSFDFIGKGYVGIIPVPVIIMIGIMAVGWVVLNKTSFGKHLYAIGGNKEAAKLSGINVNRTFILASTICGLSCGIAGVIMASRVGSGQANISATFGFDVITAVVLGGGSVDGGEGKVSGVLIGVLIMGVLSNGLALLNVYDYYQQVIKGIVLIGAVGFDKLRQAYTIEHAKASK